MEKSAALTFFKMEVKHHENSGWHHSALHGPATKSELQALKENLEQIYSKVENAEDYMSMCADADIYENYLSASNRLYELLYG